MRIVLGVAGEWIVVAAVVDEAHDAVVAGVTERGGAYAGPQVFVDPWGAVERSGRRGREDLHTAGDRLQRHMGR
ncbi:hypothetical protein GCM10010446_59830 [Streptomyces enissocaesilis]|uniref:Uncharacterized protein n=1 Tax=Streptomyces enissocaesilis TaxID=332589 RepID=A0ABN3XNR5_9ACTN